MGMMDRYICCRVLYTIKHEEITLHMDDLDQFRAFYELADRLIAEASKHEVAEAAHLLALNLAH